LTDPVIGQYSYRYQVPAKCLRVIAMVDEDDYSAEYEYRREVYIDSTDTEFDVILCDESTCFILYIRDRISAIGSWPGWFSRLVALDLAILMCEPMKQDKVKKNQLLNMMTDPIQGYLARAIQANAMEDADVSAKGVNLNRGNNDVLDASVQSEITRRYIKTE
jgi:hypothetical protein